jgi:hypothetical protein
LAPLSFGGAGVILGEGSGDEGRDDAPALFAGIGQDVAHKVDAAALPAGIKDSGDRRLDAFVGAEITA